MDLGNIILLVLLNAFEKQQVGNKGQWRLKNIKKLSFWGKNIENKWKKEFKKTENII